MEVFLGWRRFVFIDYSSSSSSLSPIWQLGEGEDSAEEKSLPTNLLTCSFCYFIGRLP